MSPHYNIFQVLGHDDLVLGIKEASRPRIAKPANPAEAGLTTIDLVWLAYESVDKNCATLSTQQLP
jgi:hypothetical protein